MKNTLTKLTTLGETRCSFQTSEVHGVLTKYIKTFHKKKNNFFFFNKVAVFYSNFTIAKTIDVALI